MGLGTDRDRYDQVLQAFHKLALLRSGAEGAIHRRACSADRPGNDGAACSEYGQKVRCYEETDTDYRLRSNIFTAGTQGRTPKEDEYKVTTTGKRYNGVVYKDHYGRPVPKHAHGTGNLGNWTSSTTAIAECMMKLYDRIIDPDLMVRRITICACNLIYENNIPEDDGPVQLELFVDYEEVERWKAEKKHKEERERALQRATLQLQGRFGKNAVLRSMNLVEGGTTIERNGQIGGHRAQASEVRKDGKRDKKQ